MSYENPLNKESSRELKRDEENQGEAKEESLEFYEKLNPRAELFANTWQYKFRIDPTAETFYFDHKKREVSISPQIVEKLNFNDSEKKFVFFHELAHLVQFMRDPKAYLETFEIAKKKGEEDSSGNKEQIEEAWHSFFNVLLDVHDNATVIDKTPSFRKGGNETETPQKLYQRLFDEEGLSEKSLSWQFLSGVIKPFMTKNENINVSEEIEELLKKELTFLGEKYESLNEFVKETIGNPHTKMKDALFYMKEVFMPIFEKLLEKDKESGKLEEKGKLKKQFGKWGEEGMDFDPEELEKILEDYKEANKDAQKSQKDRQAQEYKDDLMEKGLSEGEAERILEIQEKTREVIRDLTSLWKNFIGISTEYSTDKKEGFKTGSTIAPEQLAQQMPILLTQPSEATIFSRQVTEVEKQEFKPQKISLHLILDLSGSMDSEKKKAVQEVSYSLGKSLLNFYRDSKLSLGGDEGESPLKIDMNMTGFGDTTERILEREKEEEQKRQSLDTKKANLDEKLTKAITNIQRIDLGGTEDAPALEIAKKDSEHPETEKELKENENVMVVLEITDGETRTVNESKKIIEEMNKKDNVYTRAIQIPGPIYGEGEEGGKDPKKMPEVLESTGTFKEVWKDQGKRLEDLNSLKETIVAILYDALKNNI